jgi:hypothetical protein
MNDQVTEFPAEGEKVASWVGIVDRPCTGTEGVAAGEKDEKKGAGQQPILVLLPLPFAQRLALQGQERFEGPFVSLRMGTHRIAFWKRSVRRFGKEMPRPEHVEARKFALIDFHRQTLLLARRTTPQPNAYFFSLGWPGATGVSSALPHSFQLA